MPELVQKRLDGISSEVEHHRIAKIIKLASTQAEIKRLEVEVISNPEKLKELEEAKAEALQFEKELTSEGIAIRVSKAEYNHSVGLIMGRELWLSALPENLEDLRQKVIATSRVK